MAHVGVEGYSRIVPFPYDARELVQRAQRGGQPGVRGRPLRVQKVSPAPQQRLRLGPRSTVSANPAADRPALEGDLLAGESSPALHPTVWLAVLMLAPLAPIRCGGGKTSPQIAAEQ